MNHWEDQWYEWLLTVAVANYNPVKKTKQAQLSETHDVGIPLNQPVESESIQSTVLDVFVEPIPHLLHLSEIDVITFVCVYTYLPSQSTLLHPMSLRLTSKVSSFSLAANLKLSDSGNNPWISKTCLEAGSELWPHLGVSTELQVHGGLASSNHWST